MNVLLEIIIWLLIGLSWCFAIKKIISDYIPEHFLTWYGCVLICAAFAIGLVRISAYTNFINLLGAFSNFLLILSWAIMGLFLCLLLTRLTPRAYLRYVGALTLSFLLLYQYFIFIKSGLNNNYKFPDVNDLLSAITLQKGAWQWLTEIIIPISIPFSIALWGWWNQQANIQLSKRSKCEEDIKSFFDEFVQLSADLDAGSLGSDRVGSIARVKTILILESLEDYPQGKRRIIQFLIDWMAVHQTKIDLSEVNLSKSDLSGLFLAGAKLNRANLSFSKLQGVDLATAELRESILEKCNLRNAKLVQAELEKASISNSLLAFSDLTMANLRGAKVNSSNLSGADLRQADMRKANLSLSNFTNANLTDALLDYSILNLTTLFKAKMDGVDLENVYLNLSFITTSSLSPLNFRKLLGK